MIYYVTGLSARNIKLEEIMKDYGNVRVYDAYIKDEYDKFVDDITNQSLFATDELIILKRCEKFKNMDELIKYLPKVKDGSKSIVIDYYCEFKNKNPYIKKFDSMGATVYNIEDSNSLLEEYVNENLDISKSDCKKLINIVGNDYNHLKNEVYKYKIVLGNEKFSFEKINELITESNDKKIYEYVSDILEGRINFDNIPSNMYIPLIYSIYREFETMHKLHILKLSTDHNTFKAEYSKYDKYFNSSYYPVFLKIKYLIKYSKQKCLNVLANCNKYENMIKTGQIDDKNALWNILEYIRKVRR